MRVTIYLKSNTGPKPYKTVYFSKNEFARLKKDFEKFQKTGLPKNGAYNEEIGTSNEEIVYLDFDSIAKIKSNS